MAFRDLYIVNLDATEVISKWDDSFLGICLIAGIRGSMLGHYQNQQVCIISSCAGF